MKIARIPIWFLVAMTFAAMITSLSGMIEPRSATWDRGVAISLSEDFHISLMDGRLVFYNSLDYGPYQGSMLSMGGVDVPVVRGFGDWVGVYYRNIKWADGASLLTLAVSLWYPLILFSVLAMIYETRRYISRRQ